MSISFTTDDRVLDGADFIMTTTADSAKVERADGTLMGHDIDEAPELCWIAAQAHGGGYGMAYFGLTPESYDKVHYWGFFRSGFFAGPIPNEGHVGKETAITVYTSCAYVRDVVEGNYDDNDINMHLIKAIERITTDSGKTFDGFPRRVAITVKVCPKCNLVKAEKMASDACNGIFKIDDWNKKNLRNARHSH